MTSGPGAAIANPRASLGHSDYHIHVWASAVKPFFHKIIRESWLSTVDKFCRCSLIEITAWRATEIRNY